MNLVVGFCYRLKVNLHGRIKEYEGKVLKIIDDEFRFETDDDNKCRALTFKKNEIIKFDKIECFKKIKSVHKISSKKKFTNLKESVKPEF